MFLFVITADWHICFSFVEAPTIASNASAQLEDNRISSKNPDKCNHDEVNNQVNFDVPNYLVIDLTPRALLLHKSQEENEEKQIQMNPTIKIV